MGGGENNQKFKRKRLRFLIHPWCLKQTAWTDISISESETVFVILHNHKHDTNNILNTEVFLPFSLNIHAVLPSLKVIQGVFMLSELTLYKCLICSSNKVMFKLLVNWIQMMRSTTFEGQYLLPLPLPAMYTTAGLPKFSSVHNGETSSWW